MDYEIKLTYQDDKVVDIIIPEDDVQEFFDNISNGKIFKNKSTGMGFWTSFNSLRHIIVTPLADDE